MVIFDKLDLTNLVYGASYFGGGGGGSMEEGLKLIDELEDSETLEIIDVENEMEDDLNIVSAAVAALGSPIATQGKAFSEEAINAVNAMRKEAQEQGKELKYLYSGEMGGGNTMLPLYTAIKLGMQVLILMQMGVLYQN